MVVYFSGTGNSRYCAQMLADLLGDESLDAFHYIRSGVAADLRSGKPWVFVAPTYAWRLPRVFRDFIRSGSFEGSGDAYFVMTCGDGIGKAAKTNAKLCGEKNLHYRGTLEVLMPENYIALFDVPPKEECRHRIKAARPLLESAAHTILAGEELQDQRAGVMGALKSGPVNPVFYRVIVKDKKFRAGEKCVGCGKCVEVCPLQNISLTDGKPSWSGSCTHCMACITQCPTEAIEYGAASVGKVRYRGPECFLKPNG